MKRGIILVWGLLLTVFLAACGASGNSRQSPASLPLSSPEDTESGGQRGSQGTAAFAQWESETSSMESESMDMKVQVGDTIFYATLEENPAAEVFVEMMKSAPVTIQMRDYSGFEKVGDLGTTIPTENSQITTESGDIVLYNGNQIVIFYGTNSWSYTRLGKINDLSGWEEALGAGDVTVTFSVN